jgi:hypothetical protein
MANYCGTARSNYFRVKDEEAFKAWVKVSGVSLLDENADAEGRFGITPAELSDSGCWPTSRYDEETADNIEVDVLDELAEHLADGEVAILMEVGSEKLRYVGGTAQAINNNKGEYEFIDLYQIYKLAADLGPNITEAEY